MGHADITTTMNVYNEATKEKKVASFANLEGKIRISWFTPIFTPIGDETGETYTKL